MLSGFSWSEKRPAGHLPSKRTFTAACPASVSVTVRTRISGIRAA